MHGRAEIVLLLFDRLISILFLKSYNSRVHPLLYCQNVDSIRFALFEIAMNFESLYKNYKKRAHMLLPYPRITLRLVHSLRRILSHLSRLVAVEPHDAEGTYDACIGMHVTVNGELTHPQAPLNGDYDTNLAVRDEHGKRRHSRNVACECVVRSPDAEQVGDNLRGVDGMKAFWCVVWTFLLV